MKEIDDFATIGIWEIDLLDNSITCSQEMLHLWGLDPKSFNGNRELLQDRVHPEDVQVMKALIQKAITNEEIYEHEYRIYPAPGKEIKVLSRGQCSYDFKTKKPMKFSGIIFDVTSLK